MYCKYCGQRSILNSSICSECNDLLHESTKQKSTIPFFLIVLLGPIFNLILKAINFYEASLVLSQVEFQNYLRSQLFSLVMNIPSSGIVYVIVILVLVKLKKIKTTCCEVSDVIVWTGVLPLNVIGGIYINKFIASMSLDIVTGVSAYSSASSITLLSVWNTVCLIVFLLLRSGTIRIGKKAIILTSVFLFFWSLLMVLGAGIIIHFMRVDAASYSIAVSMYRLSAAFLWLRCLVDLMFAILFGENKAGFVCGVMYKVGGCIVSCVATALFPVTGYGLVDTIGSIVAGIILVLAWQINKKCESVEVKSRET